MRFVPDLGIRTKLMTLFLVTSLSVAIGGFEVHSYLQALESAKIDQGHAVAALNVLKDMEQVFAAANLLGMAAMVDRYEQPRIKTVRRGQFQEMVDGIAQGREQWTLALETVGHGEEVSDIKSALGAVLDSLRQLIDAVDSGEKRKEAYAEFGDKMAGAKEQGLATIAQVRSLVQRQFENSQGKMDGLLSRLSLIANIVFTFCFMSLLLWGAPTILNLSKSVTKLQLRLADVFRKMHGASRELKGVSLTLAESSGAAASAIEESMAAMIDVSAMLSETARSATDTAVLSTAVMGQAQSGVGVMQEMAQAMRGVSELSSNLKEISGVIASISAKANVINDVVFKTQLLAVSASIEAARAGESGKGFAVVANEVASLAAVSGKASSEIKDLLVMSSTRVMEIIEATSHSVKKGERASSKSSKAFILISESIGEITDKIQQIIAASRAQEAGVAQTSMALRQMNHSTAAIKKITELSANLGFEIADQATSLRQADRALYYIATGRDEPRAKEGRGLIFESEVDRILSSSPSNTPQANAAQGGDRRESEHDIGNISVVAASQEYEGESEGSQKSA